MYAGLGSSLYVYGPPGSLPTTTSIMWNPWLMCVRERIASKGPVLWLLVLRGTVHELSKAQ